MDSAIRLVCSRSTSAGFRLAGLAPQEAASPAEGAREIRGHLRQPGLGVLLVEEPIYAAIGEGERRAISRHPLPMVVPFPGPAWVVMPAAPEEFIAELLRQAIGYRVRLA